MRARTVRTSRPSSPILRRSRSMWTSSVRVGLPPSRAPHQVVSADDGAEPVDERGGQRPLHRRQGHPRPRAEQPVGVHGRRDQHQPGPGGERGHSRTQVVLGGGQADPVLERVDRGRRQLLADEQQPWRRPPEGRSGRTSSSGQRNSTTSTGGPASLPSASWLTIDGDGEDVVSARYLAVNGGLLANTRSATNCSLGSYRGRSPPPRHRPRRAHPGVARPGTLERACTGVTLPSTGCSP